MLTEKLVHLLMEKPYHPSVFKRTPQTCILSIVGMDMRGMYADRRYPVGENITDRLFLILQKWFFLRNKTLTSLCVSCRVVAALRPT